jgi:AraC family transcriptional regulator
MAEGVVLTLESEFLVHTSPELVNPDQIELLPTFAQPDPLIYGIGTTLKNNLTEGTCDRVYAETLLTSLSAHLLRHYCAFEPKLKQYQGGLPKYKLQQAIDYIQANLHEKLSLEAIAHHLNMGVYHFCDLFKQCQQHLKFTTVGQIGLETGIVADISQHQQLAPRMPHPYRRSTQTELEPDIVIQ